MRNRRPAWLAWSLAAVLIVGAATPPSRAQETEPAERAETASGAENVVPESYGQARLSGKVFESDGETPVAGSVVTVHYLSDGRGVDSSPTDRKGRFEFEDLEHGYVELTVERQGDRFAGGDFLSLPPMGRVAVDLFLTRLDERSASWWASRGPLQLPEGQGAAVGVAEVRPEVRGREFWKSKKGIAVITAVGGALLIAIAASSRNSPSDPR